MQPKHTSWSNTIIILSLISGLISWVLQADYERAIFIESSPASGAQHLTERMLNTAVKST
jgi:hypothetical protein